MRTKGSKNTVKLPSNYDTGCPEINFWKAILARACKDVGWHYARIMVEDFEKTEIGKAAKHRREKGLSINVNTEMEEVVCWWVHKYVNERWCA